MKHTSQFTHVLAIVAATWTASASAWTELQAPEGFVVERAAGPPLIHHPLMACFDQRGRLYVCDAAGVNRDEKELQAELPNGIRRLEDTDGDGRFDRSTVFADRMTFPNGGVWHGDSLYVASAPYIWRLRDADDDGVAEERTPLVGEFGFIGNAADIHGCFLGPEGRLWWCDGRHGHVVRDTAGKIISQGEAARIFSCRLDGSDFRTHCGGGMDNPVEIDFTRTGDVLGTVNLFYQTRGDCLVHWLHGGLYPRDDQPQCLAEFRRTGELLRPVLDYGHIAVSGLTRYRGQSFGAEFRDGYFVCEFNTHQVNFTRVIAEGSSFVAERHDFLRSENIDFHPTDVLEDADGSLLVVDTGGWFRYGCPTSQVAKPEISGGIYRVRRKDAANVMDPRGDAVEWNTLAAGELAKLLEDARPAVRERAQSRLVELGSAAVGALAATLDVPDAEAALAALWALHRIGSREARGIVRERLRAADPDLRQAAARCVADGNDTEAGPALLALLKDDHAGVRRAAVEALGRLRVAGATPAILDSLQHAADRPEEHAAIYALIELAETPALVAGLRRPDSVANRAALLTLDQVAPDAVPRDAVLHLLGSNDILTVRVAMDVLSKRPRWTEDLPSTWRRWLAEPMDDARRAWLLGALKSFSGDARTQAVVAELLGESATPIDVRRLLLRVIAESELSPLPDLWLAALIAGCRSDALDVRREFLAVASAARDERLLETLREAADAQPGDAMVLAGLAALGQPLADGDWATLIGAWRSASESAERDAFVAALVRAQSTDAQLIALAQSFEHAQPLELGALLFAFRRGKSADVGHALVAALAAHPGAALIGYAELRAVLASYPPAVQAAAATSLASREIVSADQQARLALFDDHAPRGDAARGRDIFFGAKANCAACHRVATRGGRIGPDLSTLGRIRTRRDLAESILYPSLTLARGYDTLAALTTADGLTYTGLVERETADVIELRTTQRELVRLRRDEIEEQAPSRTSIMPQGFDELLTEQELDDLIAYLLSLK